MTQSSLTEQCTIGIRNNDQCHRNVHTRIVGLHQLTELSDSDVDLLVMRIDNIRDIDKASANMFLPRTSLFKKI